MGASSPIALTGAARGIDGLYFRVGNNDHVALNRLIAEGKLHVNGLALDARRHERHKALRQHAARAGIATCFDTQAMELVMPGTSSKGHAQLPWAAPGARSSADFTPRRIEEFARAVVERVVDGAYPQVMAPAHYIADLSSEWLAVDEALTSELRAQLDAADQDAVRIIYPLAVHHSVFYDAEARAALRRSLRALPVDVIALRIHPFGSASGPHVMRSFMDACWDLRAVGTPLMVERAGIAGLAAFALGAVDIVESGITTGDSFDIGAALQKPVVPGKKSKFSPPQRVYIEALGMTVDSKIAAKLLNTSRGKIHFACKNPACCSNGYQDMLEDSERHSALARQRQFLGISRVPPSIRAEHFIDGVVTPLCDMLGRARDLDETFKNIHRRTLSVKEMLVDLQREKKEMHDRLVPTNPPVPQRTDGKVIQLKPREPKGR
jgi:hypothetical protein